MQNGNVDFQENGTPPQGELRQEPIHVAPVYKVWSFWPTVGFGLAIATGWLLIQIFITLLFTFKQIISQPSMTPEQLIQAVLNGDFLALATVISSAVGLGLTFLFIKILRGSSLKEYLALKKTGIKLLLILVGTTAAFLVIERFATTGLKESSFSNQMVQAYKNSSAIYLLWIAVVLIGPLFEEVFFRGFLYTGFVRSPLRVPGAIILTALLWSLMHGAQYGVWELVDIFVLGIVFGIVRWKTGSLWNTFAMHVLWNLVAMVSTAIAAGKIAG
jgi:uncharacterized protein